MGDINQGGTSASQTPIVRQLQKLNIRYFLDQLDTVVIAAGYSLVLFGIIGKLRARIVLKSDRFTKQRDFEINLN